ncbi:MAG: DUF1559 domain-containing protein [Isosphaeraceae bacterium]
MSGQVDVPRPGFRLIELLVLIGVIAVVLALLIPWIVQSRRESERLACTTNLRQLALAALNYESAWGVYPSAGFGDLDPASGARTWGQGIFTRLSPYLEQAALYNTINFDFPPIAPANITASATGLAVLWCPSDQSVGLNQRVTSTIPYANPGGWMQGYSSYGGSMGTWNLEVHPSDPTYAARHAALNGVIFGDSAIPLRAITDGTSNTLAFGEHAHGALPSNGPASGRSQYHWWNSAHSYDTLITTFYPINAPKQMALGWNDQATNLASGHPGGANAIFVDGSARFLKESIDSWPITPSTGMPAGVSYDPARRIYVVAPGKGLGILQKLSTRAGGEATP